MSGSISVVIPTLGRSEQLARTLATVLASDPLPLEVIVVDGDDAGSARSAVEEADPGGELVKHLPSPPGLSKQRNRAFAEVKGEIVLFLDDDVVIPRNTFTRLTEEYEDPSVLGVTGHVLEPDGGRVGGKTAALRRFLPGGGEEGGFTAFGYPRRLTETARSRDIQFMQGCFMSARSETARLVGFDEALTGYGLAEDEDFSVRLSRRGRIRYVADLEIVHENTGFLTRDHRRFNQQVMVNRRYLFRKNFPQTLRARIGFAMFFCTLVLHRALNREWSGMRGLFEGMRLELPS